jgi:hypothetical protein
MRGDFPTSLIFFQALYMSEAASVFGFANPSNPGCQTRARGPSRALVSTMRLLVYCMFSGAYRLGHRFRAE